MIITKTINADLWIRERTQEICAVQGDGCTRKITVKLFANREPWMPGPDASVVIRYHKPDGTGGSYDTLPNGEKAWELTDNAVSFIFAPQMLTIPGRVAVQVEMLLKNGVLASFPLHVLVEENVAAGVTSSGDYFSWEHRLERERYKTLEQAKLSGEFTGATPQLQIGTVRTVAASADAEATISGTAEQPILHLAIPKGEDAQVDTTLKNSGKAADAAAVGAALAGKAPGGYGLGSTATRTEDWNTAIHTGFYFGITNSPDDTWVYGYVIRDGAAPERVTQRAYRAGNVWTRTGTISDMGAWEWVNPAMIPGTEYRTTKRWNGKPVYTKLVECGTLPSGNSIKTVENVLPAYYRIICCVGSTSDYWTFPLLTDSGNCYLTAYGNNIRFKTDRDFSSMTANVQLWYVKD